MKNKRLILAIDMDGTICESSVWSDNFLSKLQAIFFQMGSLELKPLATMVNLLYKEYYIKIFTSRPWFLYFLTKRYLKKHGIKYDKLICGKTRYHLLIDDKVAKFTDWKDIQYMLKDL